MYQNVSMLGKKNKSNYCNPFSVNNKILRTWNNMTNSGADSELVMLCLRSTFYVDVILINTTYNSIFT